MVSFSQLSPQAQQNVQRISRGRSPENFGGDTQRFLNEATDFIDANPALRKQIQGGLPTGLGGRLPLLGPVATRLREQITGRKVTDIRSTFGPRVTKPIPRSPGLLPGFRLATDRRPTGRFFKDPKTKVRKIVQKTVGKIPGLKIDLPEKLALLEKLRFSKAGQKTEKVIRRFEKIAIPAIEDFEKPKKEKLVGFLEEEKVTPFAFGTGTSIVERKIRKKTFEEELGVKKSKDSKKLEDDFDKIQNDFIAGNITSQKANELIDTRLDKFVTKQAIKNIPKNVALGIGIAALATVPVVGQLVAPALAGDLLLRRRKVVKQFKNFPKASAIETGSFIIGGLGGSAIGKGGVGKFKKPQINEKSLSSITQLTGQQRTKLIKEASKLNPNFDTLSNQQRISNVITYNVILKDGRSFQILEFNKLSPKDLSKGLKGEKNFLGFELGKDPRFSERVIGRGVSVVKRGEAQTFIRAVRFKPIDSKIKDIFSQQLGFNKGRTIEVLSKSKSVPIGPGKFEIISESRILSIKTTGKNLSLRIQQLKNILDRGGKVSLSQIKNLINLEKRNNGQRPFSEKEFRESGFSTITRLEVQQILDKASITLDLNKKLISQTTDIRVGFVGQGFTSPGKIQPGFIKPSAIEKTPLSKTFAEEIEASRLASKRDIIGGAKRRFDSLVSRNKARNQAMIEQSRKPFSQRFNEAQAGQVSKVFGEPSKFTGSGQFELTQASSPGMIAQLLAPKLPGVSVSFLKPVILSISKLSSSDKLLLKNASAIKNRIEQTNRLKLELEQQLSSKQKLETKSEFTTATITKLAQKLNSAQKLGQKLRFLQKLENKLQSRNINITDLTIRLPKPFTSPRPKLPSKPSTIKKKKVTDIPGRIKEGYSVFAKPIKRKGQKQKPFRKINKVAVTKKKALDLGSWIVDHSLGRTFKIKKTGTPAKRPKLSVPANYFQKNRPKFRNFRISKGKKLPLGNTFIEKKTKLLDTISERKKITLIKQRSNLLKKFKAKKVKNKTFLSKPFKNKSNFKTSNSIKLRRIN